MTQLVRQNRLFAAEDYTAIYESYVNANLQAYDYDTIRSAMVDYVRNTYPENYNDWIESAEFVAMLDLIAQFGHNLAFRVDLNSRNNFLSTAERQDAVYKLANFLGYQPRRNLPAFGKMKIVSVKTNEPIIGSNGTSLGGKEIRFESNSSVDNLDDFMTVINAALSPSTQIGSPRNQTLVNGVMTQFYNMNNLVGQFKFSTSGSAYGSQQPYDLIGLSFDTTRKTLSELDPNPNSAFSIIYQNDGTGITSNNTGFFVGLKQGAMSFKDFSVDEPIDNLSLDVDVDNINEYDVWVQTIDQNGNVLKNWHKVDNAYGNSVTYNSLSGGVRDIFSVKTRSNNRVSVQFPDRKFGNIPKGIIRVWYRTSLNATYVVRPEDVGNKSISINYKGIDDNTYTITIGLQLQNSISNASSSESLDDIKVNAPRIYATQDRMITAQDYSSYLVRQSDNIIKIKSVNRTHSGHSRFLKFNDPTGAYSNVEVFGKDGVLTKTAYVDSDIVGNITIQRIYDTYIKNILSNPEILNLYYEKTRSTFVKLKENYGFTEFKWTSVNTLGRVTSGFFRDDNNAITGIGMVANTYLKYASVDSLIKFKTPTNETMWARVSSVSNYGLGVDNAVGGATGKDAYGVGAITLDVKVPQGSTVEIIYPPFARVFSYEDQVTMLEFMEQKIPFLVYYDYLSTTWKFSTDENVSTSIFDNAQNISTMPSSFKHDDPESWILCVIPSTSRNEYTINIRNIRFTLASNDVTFSNVSGEYYLDSDSKKRKRDTIGFIIDSQVGLAYVSGYDTNGNLIVVLEDKGEDSRPDNPDALYTVLGGASSVNNIRFEWTHVPAEDEIIDPSFSNIIDVFALTRIYDTAYRRYLSDSTGNVSEPLPPTIDELNQQFNQVNNKKAMSDKIVYRPVKYKALFGEKSEPGLQGRLRVVKVAGSSMTDNEIKNKIVTSVLEYFNLNNWDFGETFYFTELSAYVHKQMPGIISSLVIVPESASSVFGDLFQITPMSNEIFIPDIDTNNIDIIDSINSATIRSA